MALRPASDAPDPLKRMDLWRPGNVERHRDKTGSFAFAVDAHVITTSFEFPYHHEKLHPLWGSPLSQPLVEPRVIEQNIFHATLDCRRIQGLRAHQRVRVKGTHDGVQQLGFQVG